MQQSKYFQKALSDFTYEAASGGAIRRTGLYGKADLGTADFSHSFWESAAGVMEESCGHESDTSGGTR